MTDKRRGRSALSDEILATFVGLGAAGAGVGTNSTSVLRFLAAGTAVVSPYITVSDDAAEGTLVQLETPGNYSAVLHVPQVAATTLIMGIAVGFAVVPPFTGVPAMGTQGVIAVVGPSTLAAATAAGILVSIPFTIPDEDANTTRAIVRFVGSVAAGTTPIPAITVADAWARVIRHCDQAA